MMDNLIVPSESRIFVLEGMQTVRTGCHDAFWSYIIEDFDIGDCHLTEQVFVAGAAGRISGTLFMFSQNSKVYFADYYKFLEL